MCPTFLTEEYCVCSVKYLLFHILVFMIVSSVLYLFSFGLICSKPIPVKLHECEHVLGQLKPILFDFQKAQHHLSCIPLPKVAPHHMSSACQLQNLRYTQQYSLVLNMVTHNHKTEAWLIYWLVVIIVQYWPIADMSVCTYVL